MEQTSVRIGLDHRGRECLGHGRRGHSHRRQRYRFLERLNTSAAPGVRQERPIRCVIPAGGAVSGKILPGRLGRKTRHKPPSSRHPGRNQAGALSRPERPCLPASAKMTTQPDPRYPASRTKALPELPELLKLNSYQKWVRDATNAEIESLTVVGPNRKLGDAAYELLGRARSHARPLHWAAFAYTGLALVIIGGRAYHAKTVG